MLDVGDRDALAGLIRLVWPNAAHTDVRTEKVSHRRNADHWRVGFGDESIIVRITAREASAQRIIAALSALDDAPFAPKLRGWQRAGARYLIAMEDVGDSEPGAGDVQSRTSDFVAVIRALHGHKGFQNAVEQFGRALGEDSSRAWAEEEWPRLVGIATDDPRVAHAKPWLERVLAEDMHPGGPHLVDGHGDLHRGNWRLTQRGPVIIDWEEIRRWPLSSELADFIVFGRLDPNDVAARFGLVGSGAESVAAGARACALSFYLYWLRTLIDSTDPREGEFQDIAVTCEQLFGD